MSEWEGYGIDMDALAVVADAIVRHGAGVYDDTRTIDGQAFFLLMALKEQGWEVIRRGS